MSRTDEGQSNVALRTGQRVFRRLGLGDPEGTEPGRRERRDRAQEQSALVGLEGAELRDRFRRALRGDDDLITPPGGPGLAHREHLGRQWVLSNQRPARMLVLRATEEATRSAFAMAQR